MLALLMPIIAWVATLFRSGVSATGSVIRNRSSELLICIAVIMVGYGVYHLGSKMTSLINKTDAALTALHQQDARMNQQQELLHEMIDLQKGVIEFNQRLSEDYYANKEQRDKKTTDVLANIHDGSLRLRLNRPVGTGETNSRTKGSVQGTSTANKPSAHLTTFRVAVPTQGTFNPSSLELSAVVN